MKQPKNAGCKHSIYKSFVKRVLDLSLSVIALIILSPLLLIVAILVRIKLGSPVLFTQMRIGKNERPFKMYKFRSMSMETDAEGKLLPDKERLGKFGKLLRATSIDELPALLNIIKGDMSIIGPRPLPVLYQPYFKENERIRHSVRGGLTGLAQINGRNTLSWEDRFAYDVKYVENISFLTDVCIFFKTIQKVLMRKDVGVRGVTGPGDLNVLRNENNVGVVRQ